MLDKVVGRAATSPTASPSESGYGLAGFPQSNVESNPTPGEWPESMEGIGGWAGIGMAAGLEKDTDGLGAVGGYRELNQYTELGGSLTVFALPASATSATKTISDAMMPSSNSSPSAVPRTSASMVLS